MFKTSVIVLFSFIIFCSGLERGQEPEPGPEFTSKSESEEETDAFDIESRQDFDKTSEKERELKLLRKAKRLKESNYRRALESILPAKNSEGYRRFFEDLINNSDEKSKLNMSKKEIEEVVVTDTFVDGEGNEENNGDPQVEEIEVVIEHITDNDNNNEPNDKTIENPPDPQDPGIFDTDNPHKDDLREKPNTDAAIENKDQEQPSTTPSPETNARGRMGQDSSRSAEIEGLHLSHIEERRVLEPYPISRFSEVVIPHYRTTLTRGGVVVSPAVYTVQTTQPIIDHVTTRSWVTNRGIVPDQIFSRSASNKIGRSDSDTKLIDDYNDYGSNAYSYSPNKSLLPSRQVETKMELLTKLAEGRQAQIGNLQPFRENLYPGGYHPQLQRFYPEPGYRPLFSLRR